MFDYEDLTDEQIATLESSNYRDLASAIIIIVHGIRSGILTETEGLKQINNIGVSLS